MPKKQFFVTMLVTPRDQSATAREVKSFLYDLEWSGGCRNPDTDPMFDSVDLSKVKVKLHKPVNKKACPSKLVY